MLLSLVLSDHCLWRKHGTSVSLFIMNWTVVELSGEVSQASLGGHMDPDSNATYFLSYCNHQSPVPTSLELEFQVHKCDLSISNLVTFLESAVATWVTNSAPP